ncbi:Ubiquitin carrier protein E2 22 [Hordeum vulgare]|nr:Ubiquitin carrier protein E2 22 [Hordeum vulgare]
MGIGICAHLPAVTGDRDDCASERRAFDAFSQDSAALAAAAPRTRPRPIRRRLASFPSVQYFQLFQGNYIRDKHNPVRYVRYRERRCWVATPLMIYPAPSCRLYTDIHAHKQKNKSKAGAIYESTTALNMGEGNSTVPSKNIPSAPAQVSTSTSTKVLGIQDQNAAPSDPSLGSSAEAEHKKDGPLAVKIPPEKKKMGARKKSLKRL